MNSSVKAKGTDLLSMGWRINWYLLSIVIGIVFFSIFFYFYSDPKDNNTFIYTLGFFLVSFPTVALNWYIKNRDITKQIENSNTQIENSNKQINETLFSNSLQLLFKKKGLIANSVGLKQLIKLKQDKRIDDDIVDLITSSGLDIKGARLSRAKL